MEGIDYFSLKKLSFLKLTYALLTHTLSISVSPNIYTYMNVYIYIYIERERERKRDRERELEGCCIVVKKRYTVK